MVVGCQPYAPAAFTPRKYSWYSFLLEAESTPGSQRNSTNSTLPHTSIIASAAQISFISTVKPLSIVCYLIVLQILLVFSGTCTSLISSLYNYTGCIFLEVSLFHPLICPEFLILTHSISRRVISEKKVKVIRCFWNVQ